ncbi:MAG: hypothetical protein M1817_002221 [Caeruleum heppii]|nr:MAG: hypothetical protein M1817_002221 [Caeruleum heppii]
MDEAVVVSQGRGAGGGSTAGSPPVARSSSGTGNGGHRKRNSSLAGIDSSPGSNEDAGDDEGCDDRRRNPGVKRACNECRQQKLRCDVVQEPWQACSRCRRLRLDCKIQPNFKRVGKRNKNAEMEREIVELRRQLASSQTQTSPIEHPSQPFDVPHTTADTSDVYQGPSSQESYMGSHEAVASLLGLRQGPDGAAEYMKNADAQAAGLRKLENIRLTGDRVAELFVQYFAYYHPFLPLLDPGKTADDYYNANPLLFWTIIAVAARRFSLEPGLLTSLAPAVSRLVWSTLGEVPQNYHIVKALCLLCTWPFPVSSTSFDPTFMLCGVMMHVAMQMGLHRPSHAQDFTKFHVQLREEELKDRVKTWATCNIVAQSVATGYGQPPSTIYDWTLKSSFDKEISYRLSEELELRLRVEKFCDEVTKGLYSNTNDSVGLTEDKTRASICRFLASDFEELQATVLAHGSPINTLYLRAAGLHLRLSVFFDSNTTKTYQRDLLSLYFAATSFLECALSLETTEGWILTYASNYILQMMIAASFSLLKLLNSFFAKNIELDDGKRLFHQTIWAIRKMSVVGNDLPTRLAEVLAQLWRGGGEGAKIEHASDGDREGSLQLKVRCRMSMSLVYDSVWRWREEFQAKGRGNLDSAVKNPTNPDSAADESSASSMLDPDVGLTGVDSLVIPPTALNAGTVTPSMSIGFGDSNYEVFDPLNWVFDGLVDFPYSFGSMQGMETQGMA